MQAAEAAACPSLVNRNGVRVVWVARPATELLIRHFSRV